MALYLATKTLDLIEETIKNDQGASYRGFLGKVIPHIGDAYRTDEFPFRSHLGASGVGGKCARHIWYNFRWTTLQSHSGRLMRLFNRGHLEEARFIAMLLCIGVEVYQQDQNGNQFRISDAGGHFGGSGDGVLIGIPDVEPGVPLLGEFKTSGEKPFLQVKKEGVRIAKFEHFVQMQVYMKKMGLGAALYLVVNKNTDELYGEIVPFDSIIADEYIGRGVNLVWANDPPPKISQSPGWFDCRFCDDKPVCHKDVAPHTNCRTCEFSAPNKDGNWYCQNSKADLSGSVLTKEQQLEACPKYERKF